MHHYTREEKLKAIQLYIQYDKSPAAVMYELGYPSKNRLYKWYQEYMDNNCDFPIEPTRRSKYTTEQRSVAVEYYRTHGRSIDRIVNNSLHIYAGELNMRKMTSTK